MCSAERESVRTTPSARDDADRGPLDRRGRRVQEKRSRDHGQQEHDRCSHQPPPAQTVGKQFLRDATQKSEKYASATGQENPAGDTRENPPELFMATFAALVKHQADPHAECSAQRPPAIGWCFLWALKIVMEQGNNETVRLSRPNAAASTSPARISSLERAPRNDNGWRDDDPQSLQESSEHVLSSQPLPITQFSGLRLARTSHGS